MYDNVIYNRNMFYRDKLYDYKKLCERIALVKSKCNPPPPPDFPFLRDRPKKHEMESQRQKDIEYNKELLLKKYKSMYRKHNKYHPLNLRFQPHPPSLKLSECTAQFYELVHNNRYLGNKIKEVQRSKGLYNSVKSLDNYKKLKHIEDELIKSSKYNKNILLNLVTPFTYEKRLNKILTENALGNKGFKNSKSNNDRIFYKTATGFNNKNFNINKSNNKNENRKIKIERENILTF